MVYSDKTKKVEKDIQVDGYIKDIVDNNKIYYIAPSPADFRDAYSGSGFPFHNRKQAFDGTPNHGCQYLKDGNKFSIKLIKPNAYYDNLGSEIIYPHVTIYYDSNGIEKNMNIKLKDRISYRHIRYSDINSKVNVSFYDNQNLPIRSQEKILIDSGYPIQNIVPKNYWGLKPAL
jgi:hypothetical protein